MNSFMPGPSQSLTPDPPACNKVAQTLFWKWLKSSLNVVSNWAKLAEYFHKDEINVTCMFHSVSIVPLIDVFVELCITLSLFFTFAA